jgi:hypothetical protein
MEYITMKTYLGFATTGSKVEGLVSGFAALASLVDYQPTTGLMRKSNSVSG